MATDLSYCAKYPFSGQTRAFLETDVEFTFDKLLTAPVWDGVRRHAVSRFRAAITNGEFASYGSGNDESDCKADVLSYPLVRLMVAALHDDRLNNRLAVWESKRFYSFLEKESSSVIFSLGRELGVNATYRKDGAIVWFGDFIQYASKLKNAAWKLGNQRMVQGNVYLDSSAFARLLEEAFKERELGRLRERMNGMPAELPAGLDIMLAAVQTELEKFREEVRVEGEVQQWAFPPCMKNILGALMRGVNLPHTARFGLTSFLANVGMDSEDVLKLYTGAPDFDPKKARYQVEHICKMGYTAPYCKTMLTNRLCMGGDGLCEYVDHPLTYYRKKCRKAAREAAAPQER